VSDYIKAVVDVSEQAVRDLSSDIDAQRAVELARVGVAANDDVHLRDALVWNTAHHPPAAQRRIGDACVRLGSGMPATAREAIATLAGVSYYLAGDGVRALIAAEQALRANPEARMARMLDQALALGLPPSMLRAELQSLTPGEAIGATAHAASTPPPAAAAAPHSTAPAV